MTDAFLCSGVRSPVGRRGGVLSTVRPDDLLAHCIKEAVARSSFDPASIEDVVAGCTSQSGEDARNVGRHAGLLAGLPVEVAGQTVNRLCGSGLAAIADCRRAILCHEGDVFVAGGVESMSRAPFVISKSEAAFQRKLAIFEALGERFPNPKVHQNFGAESMPETGDNVAAELGISRAEADRFAFASQVKYEAARAAGFFDGEIAPVAISGRKGDTIVGADEHPRPGTTLEGLAGLKTLFREGVVTAGNASGVNDGAAALIIASGSAVERVSAKPLARIVGSAVAGVAPRVMGLGPVPASRKALDRAGLTLDQIDVIELNEAFASQALGCMKQLGIAADDARVNPMGGAIAIGHPLGMSGARIALSAARQLHNGAGRYALVTMCIGLGQGIAVILEKA
ncbi:acetyl-CoA C-acyltransferase [Croceicoccus ponticola]|uniref:Acetyl-CoA C-acyltransferase n=1 Tax=Croceicoccus ponticola TaxID=2217664 RepID=A0A437H213_9SPHN|nr:acetyl-CoA C-acyltransferase [Croceicoccus ponticola]RVQ69660.1 acetyl-CoA C-acyltransferase [Croceicoccus ponticola]